ncbi:MAG: nicotinate (nicotinamide) nucleotide adenylyltransferase [Spirochaetales bacterium]|nr:nicotinate (nicotinamide) nucleotide adenylyltransferase [Spirochaetales bacterium]
MRYLILGGSFNPVHIGHLMLAEEVASEFGYDQVLLVPSLVPPHKEPARGASPEDRLAMLKVAVHGRSLFVVDDCELRRGGVSYTVDTLEYISSAYRPDGKTGMVIGDDLATDFALWRDPEGVCALADVIVARRSGVSWRMDFPHLTAHNTLLPVSSTDLRERIALGKPWRWLVPSGVADYVDSHELYAKH